MERGLSIPFKLDFNSIDTHLQLQSVLVFITKQFKMENILSHLRPWFKLHTAIPICTSDLEKPWP